MTTLPNPTWLTATPWRVTSIKVAGTRDQRVSALLLVVVILSAVDLVLTLGFMTTTGLLEQNPIVQWLVATTNSPAALVAWKAVTVGFSVGILHWLRGYRSAELASWLLVGILAWLTLRWADYFEVVSSLDPEMIAQSVTVFV